MVSISRLDAKRGRYGPDHETDTIFQAMSGWQGVDGDWVAYYRFDEARSMMDDVYDEPTASGLVWKKPVRVEVLHVTDTRGSNEYGDRGFYSARGIDVRVMFDKFIQAGMSKLDIATENYLKDRMVYDNKVFRVQSIAVEGQMQERDVICGITGTELNADELVFDSAFSDWAPGGARTDVEGTE